MSSRLFVNVSDGHKWIHENVEGAVGVYAYSYIDKGDTFVLLDSKRTWYTKSGMAAFWLLVLTTRTVGWIRFDDHDIEELETGETP